MKQLSVFFQDTIHHSSNINSITHQLSKVDRQALSYVPWSDKYPYRPEVQFAIAYGHDSLFLQYDVKEKVIQAAHGKTNDPVYRDSCVEFFISLDNADSYYNFEFNCIGTVLAGFGKGRDDRKLLPGTLLDTIRYQAVISREESERLVKWQLTVSIPFHVFTAHSVSSLRGRQCRANFYKCGDSLPEPHFLSWSEIQSSEQNFHLPHFFGILSFK